MWWVIWLSNVSGYMSTDSMERQFLCIFRIVHKDLSSSSRIKKGAWKNASRWQSYSIFCFLCQIPQNDPPFPRVLVNLALHLWLHMTQRWVICLFGVPKYAITWHEVEGQFGDMRILKKQYMPLKREGIVLSWLIIVGVLWCTYFGLYFICHVFKIP